MYQQIFNLFMVKEICIFNMQMNSNKFHFNSPANKFNLRYFVIYPYFFNEGGL